MTNKLKIGIIFGGLSSEAEVSLMGGRNVFNHIDRNRWQPIALYWDKQARFWELSEILVIRNTTKEIEERLEKFAHRLSYEDLSKKIDMAFLITHGKYGDDGCLQGLWELLKIPYTGSGVLSAALGMDKDSQRKLLALDKTIQQPAYQTVTISQWQAKREQLISELVKKFSYPLTVKPSREGSTIGVGVIRKKEDFQEKFTHAFAFDNEVIVEPFLKGREFSCVILGGEKPRALLPTETVHQSEVFSYDEKYLPGASEKVTPMEIEEKVIKEIQRQALATFKILGCKTFARIDGFVLDNNHKVLITDPNSAASTGLGPSSWTWHQAAKAGYNVREFITKLIEISLAEQKDKNYFI